MFNARFFVGAFILFLVFIYLAHPMDFTKPWVVIDQISVSYNNLTSITLGDGKIDTKYLEVSLENISNTYGLYSSGVLNIGGINSVGSVVVSGEIRGSNGLVISSGDANLSGVLYVNSSDGIVVSVYDAYRDITIYDYLGSAFVTALGSGDIYNYAGFSLWDLNNRGWLLLHRRYPGEENYLIFEYYNGTDYKKAMVLSSDLSIGMGTKQPTSKLHVSGYDAGTLLSLNVSGILYVNESSSGVGIGSSNPLAKLHVSGSNDLTLLSLNISGRLYVNESTVGVGINIPSPRASLEVVGDVNSDILMLSQYPSQGYAPGDGLKIVFTDTRYTPTMYFGNIRSYYNGDGTHSLVLGANGNDTTHIFIKNTGEVGINTTNPTETLYVVGNIYATGTVTGSASDINLKKNLQPQIDVLNNLSDINLYVFEWNEKASMLGYNLSWKNMGLVAQEVEKKIPFVVNTRRVCSHNMSFCMEVKSIDYARLSAVLLVALREEKEKRERLEEEVNNIKKELCAEKKYSFC